MQFCPDVIERAEILLKKLDVSVKQGAKFQQVFETLTTLVMTGDIFYCDLYCEKKKLALFDLADERGAKIDNYYFRLVITEEEAETSLSYYRPLVGVVILTPELMSDSSFLARMKYNNSYYKVLLVICQGSTPDQANQIRQGFSGRYFFIYEKADADRQFIKQLFEIKPFSRERLKDYQALALCQFVKPKFQAVYGEIVHISTTQSEKQKAVKEDNDAARKDTQERDKILTDFITNFRAVVTRAIKDIDKTLRRRLSDLTTPGFGGFSKLAKDLSVDLTTLEENEMIDVTSQRIKVTIPGSFIAKFKFELVNFLVAKFTVDVEYVNEQLFLLRQKLLIPPEINKNSPGISTLSIPPLPHKNVKELCKNLVKPNLDFSGVIPKLDFFSLIIYARQKVFVIASFAGLLGGILGKMLGGSDIFWYVSAGSFVMTIVSYLRLREKVPAIKQEFINAELIKARALVEAEAKRILQESTQLWARDHGLWLAEISDLQLSWTEQVQRQFEDLKKKDAKVQEERTMKDFEEMNSLKAMYDQALREIAMLMPEITKQIERSELTVNQYILTQ